MLRSASRNLERKRLADFASAESAVDDFVEKTKKIREIDPKTAIQTSGVQSSIHHRVVPLDHHEAFTFEAVHRVGRRAKCTLFDSVHDEGQAARKQPSAEDRRTEGNVGTSSSHRMSSVEQVSYAPLHHQNREGEQGADSEPPPEGSHPTLTSGAAIGLKTAPVGQSSRGGATCQAD
jgi:hypothetical protein